MVVHMLITPKIQEAAKKATAKMLQAWRDELTRRAEQNSKDMARLQSEYEEMDREVDEQLKRGARQTNGFIV